MEYRLGNIKVQAEIRDDPDNKNPDNPATRGEGALTVFEARPVDTETVETTSVKDYNRIVEEHREKTGFYLVADHRRINGTVQITELQPLGKVTVENSRRERVYEATNRILEYAPGAELHNGEGNEPFHKIEEQVDTILSTIGVPDRVINQ